MRLMVNYIIAWFVWAIAAALWIAEGFPYLFVAILVGHIVELAVIGLRTGKQCRINPRKTIFLCLLYGFLWWLPLRRQISNKESTNH